MNKYTTKVLMLTLFTLWLGVFSVSPGYALTFIEAQKLLASEGAYQDFFGISVSISGDTAVIGARGDANSNGSAYVFVRDGTGVWRQQQRLTASDGEAGDGFGVSVSLSGDTVVIGAGFDNHYGRDSGSAYVFVRKNTVWSQKQKLTASDGARGDRFGQSVSISRDTAMIGAPDVADNGPISGSIYVFVRDNAGVWREQQKFTASDIAEQDRFGRSVSISGEMAVIGSGNDDDFGWFTGSAYVFARDSTGLWREQQKLMSSDGLLDQHFGQSVSISGNTVLIGASEDDATAPSAGAAYVFVRDGTGMWGEQQKLTASDGASYEFFGLSVSILGDTAVIGAALDDDNGDRSGSAYVYVRDGAGVWNEQQKLTARDGSADAHFGFSVSLSGDTVVIGAVQDDDNGTRSGSAYIFEASDPNNDLLTLEKLINHRVRPTPDTAAELLAGTRYRADYKVTNNSPDRIYRVRVFEDGQLVCNLYDIMPGQSKQPARCANYQDVLAGLNNVPANVTAKVSGTSQELANRTNAYYLGFDGVSGKLNVTHYVNDKNADTQANAVTVNGNQAVVKFRVENTGSIKLYRVKLYHDPASPVNSGWQELCFKGTLMPGEVRYCKGTINVTHGGLNKAFGRAQGEDANVSPIGFVNASNPTYFNVVLP